MIRQSLSEMLVQLRAEAGQSLNTAHGPDLETAHTELLNRIQYEQAIYFDWPQLKVTRDIEFEEGQRLVNPAADLPITTINRVSVFAENTREIVPSPVWLENLNPFDVKIPSWPPCAWRAAESGELELHPTPDRAGIVRVWGTRIPLPLVARADMSELDGHMLVLFAAAEVLANNQQENADLKLRKAIELRERLLGQSRYKRGAQARLNAGDPYGTIHPRRR